MDKDNDRITSAAAEFFKATNPEKKKSPNAWTLLLADIIVIVFRIVVMWVAVSIITNKIFHIQLFSLWEFICISYGFFSFLAMMKDFIKSINK
jgi:hypothetical protein